MRLLLDTHVLIWVLGTPERIRPSVLDMITDTANSVHVSVVSPWEIAIKSAAGRLQTEEYDLDGIATDLATSGFALLPVVLEHALKVRHLPLHHADPFDRMLIGQALHEGMALVTADRAIRAYDVPIVWTGRR